MIWIHFKTYSKRYRYNLGIVYKWFDVGFVDLKVNSIIQCAYIYHRCSGVIRLYLLLSNFSNQYEIFSATKKENNLLQEFSYYFLKKSLPGLASIDFANSSRKVTQDLIHFLASPFLDNIFDPTSVVTHHSRYHYILCLSKKKTV